jgi:alkylated DNA repair dioxygenase AlkB
MIHFVKGALKDFNPVFDDWDPPVVRETKNGMVYGRPSRGFGDAPFHYAGKFMKPEPWSDMMKEIKEVSEKITQEELGIKTKYTFCLCGYYSEKGEGIPHHSDTVPTEDDLVFSASFGAPRIFEWRQYSKQIKEHVNTSDITIDPAWKHLTTSYVLEHGDVLIFNGRTQMTSTHGVPDVQGVGERINLTFRSGL